MTAPIDASRPQLAPGDGRPPPAAPPGIGVFMLVLAAASFAASVLTGTSIHWSRANLWVVIAFFGWQFFYYAYSWTTSGKTPGMVLLGVKVVGLDGGQAGTRRGVIRT